MNLPKRPARRLRVESHTRTKSSRDLRLTMSPSAHRTHRHESCPQPCRSRSVRMPAQPGPSTAGRDPPEALPEQAAARPDGFVRTGVTDQPVQRFGLPQVHRPEATTESTAATGELDDGPLAFDGHHLELDPVEPPGTSLVRCLFRHGDPGAVRGVRLEGDGAVLDEHADQQRRPSPESLASSLPCSLGGRPTPQPSVLPGTFRDGE